jgi:hypothetical protein
LVAACRQDSNERQVATASISVLSDHCEYIEIDSLEPTVGGMSTLAMLKKLEEMEPEDTLETVITCEVGDEE